MRNGSSRTITITKRQDASYTTSNSRSYSTSNSRSFGHSAALGSSLRRSGRLTTPYRPSGGRFAARTSPRLGVSGTRLTNMAV